MKTNMMTTLKIKALHRLAVMLLLKLLCFGCGLSRGVKQLLDYVLDGGLENDTLSGSTGQTASMKAAVYLQTSDIQDAQGRVDPLSLEQWYLTDTNVFAAWGTQAEQAAGQGNNITPQTFSNHATIVAGVMVVARNGEGGVGVAYNASLAGHYIQGEGLEVSQLNAEITAALAKFKNFDVVNNSWGPTSNFLLNATQSNHYPKRSCLRLYLLGYMHKRLTKYYFARPDPICPSLITATIKKQKGKLKTMTTLMIVRGASRKAEKIDF